MSVDNPELLIGFLLILTSVVGVVGGNMALGPFNLNLKTAQGAAYAFLSIAGLLGLVMVLRELFGT
jgi:hypothetical protein